MPVNTPINTDLTEELQGSYNHDAVVDYESARDVLNWMISICMKITYEEEAKENPDAQLLKALDDLHTTIISERNTLRWDDPEAVARVRREYGAKVKAYKESGICPV